MQRGAKKDDMPRLILLRHGQSQWNLENRFTGWTDVDLTEAGRKEAQRAGRLIQEEGLDFQVAFTSVLKRAIRTLWITMDVMDRMWVPVQRTWRLNERHYGALQGLDKKEMVEKHGAEQVQLWRRSYDVPPPPLALDDPRSPQVDLRYQEIDPTLLPRAESLKDTVNRFLPYWTESIVPELKAGKTVLIAAHGNSLRALVKHLDGMSEQAIVELNIPTGIPLVYELDALLKPVSNRYLGDPELARKASEAVAKQTG